MKLKISKLKGLNSSHDEIREICGFLPKLTGSSCFLVWRTYCMKPPPPQAQGLSTAHLLAASPHLADPDGVSGYCLLLLPAVVPSLI